MFGTANINYNTHNNAGSCADRDVEKLTLSRDALNLRPTCTSKICGSFLLSPPWNARAHCPRDPGDGQSITH